MVFSPKNTFFIEAVLFESVFDRNDPISTKPTFYQFFISSPSFTFVVSFALARPQYTHTLPLIFHLSLTLVPGAIYPLLYKTMMLKACLSVGPSLVIVLPGFYQVFHFRNLGLQDTLQPPFQLSSIQSIVVFVGSSSHYILKSYKKGPMLPPIGFTSLEVRCSFI